MGTLLMIFLPLGIQSCHPNKENSERIYIDSLLWHAPSECISVLTTIDTTQHSKDFIEWCKLKSIHAKFRIEHELNSDSTLLDIIEYFEGTQDHLSLGEAYYILGRNYCIHGDASVGTFFLKLSESNLESCPENYLLHGLTLYMLGHAAEGDLLFSIANTYFKRSIPYFQKQNDSIYLFAAYRDIARTTPDTLWDDVYLYFDSALQYCPATIAPGYMIEYETYRSSHFVLTEKEQIAHYHQLCDSLHEIRYAYELGTYYLKLCDYDSADVYLQILSADTLYKKISKEQYWELQSEIQRKKGMLADAFESIKYLHKWQSEQIESSMYTRTYIVEQCFDAERERAAKLHAENKRHIAYLWLLVVCILTLLITSICAGIIYKRNNCIKQQQEMFRHLEAELRSKRLFIHEILQQRIQLVAKLNKKVICKKQIEKEELEKFIQQVAVLDEKQWEQIERVFDKAWQDVLRPISSQVATLSKSEKRHLILLLCHCTTEDICLLCNISKRTVWNRNQIIKQQLNIPPETNTEEWIRQNFVV